VIATSALKVALGEGSRGSDLTCTG